MLNRTRDHLHLRDSDVDSLDYPDVYLREDFQRVLVSNP